MCAEEAAPPQTLMDGAAFRTGARRQVELHRPTPPIGAHAPVLNAIETALANGDWLDMNDVRDILRRPR